MNCSNIWPIFQQPKYATRNVLAEWTALVTVSVELRVLIEWSALAAWSVVVSLERCGAAVQASDILTEKFGILYCRLEPWTISFISCSSSSLSCMNKYVAIDNGDYLWILINLLDWIH